MRLFTIISGVMLIMTSLFCFANPGETFLALAFILGLAMILTGLVQMAAYWWGRDNRHDNNGWIFSESLITFILGILVLTSLIAADTAVPMVFGLWVMFSGSLRIVAATMIDIKSKKGNFIWTMATGVVSMGAGIYAFMNPYTAATNIAVLLGLLFMVQGACTLELGIHMPHEKKEKVKKPKAKMIKIQIKKPVKKNHSKKKNTIVIPQIDIAKELNNADIEKYKTEEIKIDDIRAALEFNMGSQEPEAPAVEETVEEADAPAIENAEVSIEETAEVPAEEEKTEE